jgi:hypothetical protein
MSAMPWGTIAGAGMADIGSNFAAGGSYLGAIAQNRAGRQARDFYKDETTQGMARLALMAFGDKAVPFLKSSMNDWTFRHFMEQNPGFAEQAQASGAGAIGQLEGLNQDAKRQGGNLIRGFDRGSAEISGFFDKARREATGRFDNLATGAEGIAANYGRGGSDLIDQEAQRALTGANQTSTAALQASGFGNSTLVGNQLAGNERDISLGATRQKLDLQRESTDRLLAARSARQSGLASLDSSFLGQQGAVMAGQQAQRAGLQQANQERIMQTGLYGPQAMLGLGQSSVFNPFLGQNTSQYYPGYSPLGSALVSKGNSLTAAGGAMAGGGF